MNLLRLAIFAGISGSGFLSANQIGAEAVKKTVSAEIVDRRLFSEGDYIVGNVEVTYQDGSKDHWTRLATAMMPGVSNDGVVGWVDCRNGSDGLRFNRRGDLIHSNLVICDRGRVTARIGANLPFIEKWAFDPDGKHVVIISRSSHGPGTLERFLRADGSRVDQVLCYEGKELPDWAKPYAVE